LLQRVLADVIQGQADQILFWLGGMVGQHPSTNLSSMPARRHFGDVG
jgi:hypothetical protein